jgi:hypothetical protein
MIRAREANRLREALTLRDEAIVALAEATNWALERAKEDLGWTKLVQDYQKGSSPLPRSDAIPMARRAFVADPFMKRGIWTLTEFAFGNGIDGPRAPRVEGMTSQEAQQALEPLVKFWNDRGNQSSLFSPPMQYERSNQLLVDGDLFFALFVRPGKGVQVRRFGPLLVKDIITDPEDAGRPLYYVSESKEQRWDDAQGKFIATGQTKRKFYRDFRNTLPADDPLSETVDADRDVYMMHVPINRIEEGGFGNSDLLAAYPFSRGAKMIGEDQATISRATAALMNVMTATGDEAALANLKTSLHSVTNSNTPAAPLPGGMNILGGGTNLSVNRASTQAGDAWQNSRIMRVPMAAGLGLALHYLADPENASLATSTSMELPIMRHLQAYQSLWLSIYRSMFDFVLEQLNLNPDDVPYDIPAPKIVEPDVQGQGDNIIAAGDGGYLTRAQVSQRLLELHGFDDIPARLEEIEAEDGEADTDQSATIDSILAAQADQAPAAPVVAPVAPPAVPGQ